jgi:hypothetical protein
MKRAWQIRVRAGKGGAVCALLAALLCLSPLAEAAKKKPKAAPKKPAQTVPSKSAKKAPERLLPQILDRKTASQPGRPAVEAKRILEIPRDQVSPEGVLYAEVGGRSQPLRLPASIDFREGNLFSAGDRWIRVTHLSRNTRQPAFKLGRREKYFHDNSLYPQEEAILEYAKLHLYPKPGAHAAKIAVEAWTGDLDSFLSLHRNDPAVLRQVEAFVFKFANQPPRGYLPGDQLWDTRRRFATWNQFFEYPLQYDMSGTALMVDGRPLERIPVFVSKEKIPGLPKLYPNVLRNLEYTFEALRTVMFESNEVRGDDGLAEVAAIRRSYLTLKLLKTGHELWERIHNRGR